MSSDSAVFKITGTYSLYAGPTNYYLLSFTLYSYLSWLRLGGALYSSSTVLSPLHEQEKK